MTEHPLTTRVVHTLKSERSISINLSEAGVPTDARKVVVYAKVRTGWNGGKDESGDIVVSTKTITGLVERKLHYHVYEQSAWAYNSENMELPITPGVTKTVDAEIRGDFGSGFYASVEIIGFIR